MDVDARDAIISQSIHDAELCSTKVRLASNDSQSPCVQGLFKIQKKRRKILLSKPIERHCSCIRDVGSGFLRDYYGNAHCIHTVLVQTIVEKRFTLTVRLRFLYIYSGSATGRTFVFYFGNNITGLEWFGEEFDAIIEATLNRRNLTKSR